VAPKADARQITTDDVKRFLAWRKSKGFDPGTTLYTDRVILHNFFSKLKLDNPVKEVPRLPRFRKKPVAYTDSELKKFFAACDAWEKAFFALALSSGLRRGELKTLHWSDLDIARKRVYVTAKPEYQFTPKDWEERSVPLTREVAQLMKKHPHMMVVRLFSPRRAASRIINFAGAETNKVTGINNRGCMVGVYTGSDGNEHGFKAGLREADGDGEEAGKHGGIAYMHVHEDDCIQQPDREDYSDPNSRTDFHSTQVTTVTYDNVAHSVTIAGLGTNNGLPVAFTIIAVGSNLVSRGIFSITLSDGYSNSGSLFTGAITLQ